MADRVPKAPPGNPFQPRPPPTIKQYRNRGVGRFLPKRKRKVAPTDVVVLPKKRRPLMPWIKAKKKPDNAVAALFEEPPSLSSIAATTTNILKRSKKVRLASVFGVSFILAALGTIALLATGLQLLHSFLPSAGASWLRVFRASVDYTGLWALLTRNATVPSEYLAVGATIGFALGGVPAVFTLLGWLRIVMAQSCRAGNNYAGGATFRAAWCDAARGGRGASAAPARAAGAIAVPGTPARAPALATAPPGAPPPPPPPPAAPRRHPPRSRRR